VVNLIVAGAPVSLPTKRPEASHQFVR